MLLRSAAARRSANGEAVAVGLERLVELALRHQHVADLVVGDRQIALPLRVAAIGGGEALADGEAVAVGLERLVELALRHQHVADLVVRDRQIALPLRVAAIGGGEALMMSRFARILQRFSRDCPAPPARRQSAHD